MSKPHRVSLHGIAICLLLAGCDRTPFESPPPADWMDAPKTHICTNEQMEKVKDEAEWCSANTSYFSTYCYGTSLMRNCAKRGQ